MIGEAEIREMDENEELIDRAIHDTINNLRFLAELPAQAYTNRIPEFMYIIDAALQAKKAFVDYLCDHAEDGEDNAE